MEKNLKQNNQDINWDSEAESGLHSSEWLGAVLLYALKFGKKEFSLIYKKENTFRNALLGWLLKIILLALIIFLLIYLVNI